MKRVWMIALATTFVVPTTILAHGLPFNALSSGGSLQTDQQAYWGGEATFAPFTSGGTTIQQWRGAFTVPSPAAGIADGTLLTFDVAGVNHTSPDYNGSALIYWDGTKVAPTSETLTIFRSPIKVLVTPSTTFLPGAVVGNYNASQLGWHGSALFQLPDTAAPGLYAVGLRFSSPDYSSSETFWAIGNLGLTPEQYDAGVAAILAAVPEPASIVGLSIGLIVLVGAAIRKRACRA